MAVGDPEDEALVDDGVMLVLTPPVVVRVVWGSDAVPSSRATAGPGT